MTQKVVLVDYGSGNLRSAAKALERAAREAGLACDIIVTGEVRTVRTADRVMLPGVGAFGDCRQGLLAIDGMTQALEDAALHRGVPTLGICVGMQLMADEGLEHGQHQGFGWIGGAVVPIQATDPALKIPHMGWNEVELTQPGSAHPVARSFADPDHAYFVHSYQFKPTDTRHILAHTKHGCPLVAIVGRDNIIGTQFHPEKSQAAGLRFLTRFLEWTP